MHNEDNDKSSRQRSQALAVRPWWDPRSPNTQIRHWRITVIVATRREWSHPRELDHSPIEFVPLVIQYEPS